MIHLGNLKLGNWRRYHYCGILGLGRIGDVGIQVFQQKGIEAFAIWAAANSLTLAARLAVYKGTAWHAKLAAVVPAWSRPLYEAITYVIRFFSVLVNIGYKDSVLHAGR